MLLLAQRLALPDVQGLPDWQVAQVLNTPDATLPTVRVDVPTGDVQEVLLTSGEWAGIVLAAESASTPGQVRTLAILMRDTVRQSSTIGTSQPPVYASTAVALTGLVQAGLLETQTRDALLSLVEKPQSWAAAHGIEVTARTVGLARGGI
jgi:hypothetical protein